MESKYRVCKEPTNPKKQEGERRIYYAGDKEHKRKLTDKLHR